MYGMKQPRKRHDLGGSYPSSDASNRSPAMNISERGSKMDPMMKDNGQAAYGKAGANVKVSKPKRFAC